jgi:hypothetical protein
MFRSHKSSYRGRNLGLNTALACSRRDKEKREKVRKARQPTTDR